jgi:hypothetical protein
MKDRQFVDQSMRDARKLARYLPQPAVAVLGKPGQEFYECGICGAFHPVVWDGDCRDGANSFPGGPEQLDGLFPGWVEVDMPT